MHLASVLKMRSNQVTRLPGRLPVRIVMHNVYATHNTMITNGLPLFSKLF